jgi:signal transduction histidine kinase
MNQIQWSYVKKNNSFQNSRTKTDKSLKFERNKTDNYMQNESQSIEDESDETLNSNRLLADVKLQAQRAQTDSERSDNLTPQLDAERERSDKAQEIARTQEDNLRTTERHQKKLIAEASLENERKDTDSNLLNERNGVDKISMQDSISVSNAETALVTRDQYLAIVSHDLKNPLNSISLSAGLLKRTLTSGEVDKNNIVKTLDMIERNVASMDRMISDLLDVEQMSNNVLLIKPEICNLCDLLKESREIFTPALINKSFTMTIDCEEDVMNAFIDHDRILQVLSNLIGNALKFTPPKGEIRLSVEKNGNEMNVIVRDNGPGIPDDKKSQIFERFSQLKLNDRRGLGLGLFISKWIVEAHGGSIVVLSEPGQGCAFSFSVPVAEALH